MKTENVQIRMEKSMRKSLETLANKDNRTLSDFIRLQLKLIIESSKNKK